MFSVLEVQKRLAELGFDPGPADGVRGRKTINAIKAFQKSKRLVADGIVGPKTIAKLFEITKEQANVLPATDQMPWLDLAYKKKGLHEVRNNSALRQFLKLGKGTIGDPAKIPWCGDFVETCIAVTLPDEPLPANPYAAINWMKFGKAVTPQKGAILIFWRGSPNGWQGHIGFYVGEDSTHYHVLGGNQSNSVTVSRIAKNRLRTGGSRWPTTALEPTNQVIRGSGENLDTTTNEA